MSVSPRAAGNRLVAGVAVAALAFAGLIGIAAPAQAAPAPYFPVLATIENAGAGTYLDIVRTSDDSRAFALSYGSGTGLLTIVDTEQGSASYNTVLSRNGMPGASGLTDIVASPDSDVVYLIGGTGPWWDGKLWVLDATTGTIEAELDFAYSLSGVQVSPDGDRLYVAGEERLEILDVADPSSPTYLDNVGTLDLVPATTWAGEIVTSLDGARLYAITSVPDSVTATPILAVQEVELALGGAPVLGREYRVAEGLRELGYGSDDRLFFQYSSTFNFGGFDTIDTSVSGPLEVSASWTTGPAPWYSFQVDVARDRVYALGLGGGVGAMAIDTSVEIEGANVGISTYPSIAPMNNPGAMDLTGAWAYPVAMALMSDHRGYTADDSSETITVYDLDVVGEAPQITTTSLPDAEIDQPYSAFVEAIGTPDPTFEVTDWGTLPTGFALDAATGEITGTPTELGGPWSFYIRASNGVGTPAESEQLSITIVAQVGAKEPVWITPETLPSGLVGEAVDLQLVADGGTATPTYALEASSELPPGLTLDADGRLHGTPTDAVADEWSTFSFGVTASNLLGDTQRWFSVQYFAAGTDRADQTIDFAPLPATMGVYGVVPVFTPTASSGLSVAVTVDTPEVCDAWVQWTGEVELQLNAEGVCTIRATQAGDIAWNAAQPVIRSITVGPDAGPVAGAPTDVVAAPGDGEIALSWTAPSDEGGSAITDYTIEYSIDGGTTWTTFVRPTSTATTATVTGLVNGTAYVFRVSAFNGHGASDPSAPSDPATPATGPSAPIRVVGASLDGGVLLTWQMLTDGGSPVLDFLVEFSADGGANWTAFSDGTSPAASATITGLTNGTPYVFRVTTDTALGTSGPSAGSTAVTPRAPVPAAFSITPTEGPAAGGTQVTVTPPSGTTFVQLDQGDYHALAIGTDGKTYAWGDDYNGQLGDGAPSGTQETPVEVVLPAGVTFTRVSAGGHHSLAIGSDGRTYAWGLADDGRLGNGATSGSETVPAPVTMPPGVVFTSVYAGDTHSLAIGSNGRAYAWGRGSSGQLGIGTLLDDQPVPAEVTMPPGVSFVEIVAAFDNSFAIGSDGELYGWGDGSFLGDEDYWSDQRVPVKITMPTEIVDIAAGAPDATGITVLAIGADDRTYAWGIGHSGELGNGAFDYESLPVLVDLPSGVVFTDVAVGAGRSSAIDDEGHAWAWGANASATPDGWGSFEDASSPVAVPMPAGVTFTSIDVAGDTLALGSDQLAYPWAWFASGLFDGTSRLAPVPLQTVDLDAVTFDGAAGDNLQYLRFAGTWSVTTPVHAAGLVDVSLDWTRSFDSPQPAMTLTDGFEFLSNAPGKPTNVTATPTETTLEISWTPPTWTGEYGIDLWIIEVRPTGGTWVEQQEWGAATTTHIRTGLDPATEYEVRVQAASMMSAPGPWSDVVTATTLGSSGPVTPGAPTDVSGTAGDAQVELVWDAPASTGGSVITDYEVQYSSDGGTSWSTFADGTSVSTSATITGLTNGTSYVFQVRAVNSVGAGAFSATSASVTPVASPPAPTVPDAPTGVAGFPDDGEVELEWSAPSDGGSPITGYEVRYSSDAGGSWTVASVSPSASPVTVSGLTNGTSYVFEVRAVNGEGPSAWSTTSAAVTPQAPVTAPGAPTALAGTAGDTQVVLTWVAPPSDGGSAILDYTVQYSSDGGSTWTVFSDGTSTTPGATVTGLTNGTSYVFQVAAVNAIGTGAASANSAAVTPVASTPTPTAPSAPTALSGTAGDAQVPLTWLAPVSDGGSAITDYEVQYSSDAGANWVAFVRAPSTHLGATVTGLTNDTPYVFQVRAVNTVGAGVWSATSATITPIAPTPTPTVPGAPLSLAGSAGDGSVALTWVAPTSDGGSAITEYTVEFSSDGGASWTTFARPASTDLFATVTGLTNGTSYVFQVAALNAVGTGSPSALSSAITPVAPTPTPTAPTSLLGTAGDGQVVLTWLAPASDGGSAITDYLVQFSSDGGTSWSTFSDGVSTSTGATVTGLTNGTPYVFQVAAVNAVGTGGFSSASAALTPVAPTPTPTVPGAPTSLLGTAGDGQVVLTWLAPASNGGSAITDYTVQYSSDGGSTWSTYSDAVSAATGATITGLVNGTSYVFQVAAVNSVGTGAFSAVSAAATPVEPTPPTPVAPPTDVIVHGGFLQALVAWERSTGDLGIGTYTYTVTLTQGSSTFTCTTTVTSCVITGLAPGAVSVSVVATASGVTSVPATGTGTVADRVDVAPTPPADQGGASVEFRDASGRVVTAAVPGQTLTVVATGFAPNSSVDVFIYSTPQHLGSGLANALGSATFLVTVPAGLSAGSHTLVAQGLSGAGATATAAVVVSIEAGAVAVTGSDLSGIALGGALLLGLGLLLIVRARRGAAPRAS